MGLITGWKSRVSQIKAPRLRSHYRRIWTRRTAAMYNLLIVDDEPLTREYLKLHIPVLHPDWHVTAEAMDGSEAWEILQKMKFDLIITDIKMPIMDGLELCRLIYERNPKQKTVILSGFDEFSLAKEAMRYGVT